MTRDEIIRMAREAALINCDCCLPFWPEEDQVNWEIFFERFAALVAAAERERLHDKFMQIHHSQQHSNNYWHFAARKIKEEA